MQRPTPSTKSRYAGTALTGVLGALALFATAGSAANADDQGKTSLSIGEDHFVIDGREITDRRFVLLTNPMAGMEPRFEALADFGGVVAAMDFSRLEALKELGELEALVELGALAGLDEKLANLDLGIEVTEDENGSMTIVIPKTEIRIDEILSDADVWVEGLEGKIELFQTDMDEWAEELEADMEVWSVDFAKAFDDEFGDEIEARTGIVSALAKACEKQTFSDNKPVVLTRRVDGADYKAICAKSDKDALSSEEIKAFVVTNPGLSKDEVKVFLENRSGRTSFHINTDRSDNETDQSVE